MATVTAISTKGGGGGKVSLEYICRNDKTEGRKYVTALNCSLLTAYQEFKNTREMYGKIGGIRYYHFVQSHPSGYKIETTLAHEIAVDFAERAFKGYECVVATHTDADHIHSHFILNAVNAETGLKYHSNKFTLNDLRQLSDEICQKYGVATLPKSELRKRTDGITTGEYRSAMKCESWKIDLINTIDMVMKKAKSKKQFCFYMKQKGYSVRWEDSRKYITYTCPNGKNVVITGFTTRNTERRIWNMNSKLEEMKAASMRNLQEALDTPTMVYVPDSNWQAAISQLKLLTEAIIEVKARVDQAMTTEQMKLHLQNQQVIFDQVLEKSQEIQELTSQNVTAEVSKLDLTAKELSSLAGKLNERTLSQLKLSDEHSRKHSFRLLRLVVMIEILHLILSAALLLWLR